MFRNVIAIALLLCTAHPVAWARKPTNCALWCPYLETVAEIGKSDRDREQWAFAILRAAAENRPHEIDEATAQRAGLGQNNIKIAPFWDVDVRRTAFGLIATLPAEISIPYLRSVTPDAFPDDSDKIDIYPYVRIALHKAHLLTIPSRAEQYQFLADTLKNAPEDDWFIYVQEWSAEELCDWGVREFLPVIEGFLVNVDKRRYPQRLRDCQERMTVVHSNADRGTALRQALTVENARSNQWLVHWAIAELKKLRTSTAQRYIETYLDQLEAIPGRSPAGRDVRPVLTAYGRALLPLPPE